MEIKFRWPSNLEQRPILSNLEFSLFILRFPKSIHPITLDSYTKVWTAPSVKPAIFLHQQGARVGDVEERAGDEDHVVLRSVPNHLNGLKRGSTILKQYDYIRSSK